MEMSYRRPLLGGREPQSKPLLGNSELIPN
jgi:hypothetical protein